MAWLLLQLNAAGALRGGLEKEKVVAGGLRHGSSELARKKDDIYFLHIPRTSGTSFITDAKASLNTVRNKLHFGYQFHHMEGCYDWRSEFDPPPKVATMIRSPRHLVFSEYLLCSEGPVGLMTQVPQADKNGFPLWIQRWHEILSEGGGVGDFSNGATKESQLLVKLPVTYTNLPLKCYNPANMMSQRLTCELPYKFPAQINVSRAIGNMKEAWFVGITEAYQESMCLFNFKVYGKLPKYCDCTDHDTWGDFDATTKTYHDSRLKSTPLAEQEDWVIDMIDNMTALDLQVYEAAVERFKREVREVEQATGVKVTCRSLPDPRAKMGVKSKPQAHAQKPKPAVQLSEKARHEAPVPMRQMAAEWARSRMSDGLRSLMEED